MSEMKTMRLEYDPQRYPFAVPMQAALGIDRLDELHQGSEYPLLSRHEDQSTQFHAALYDLGPDFYDIYIRFLTEVVQPFIGEDIIYQRVPTFRVHLPGNVAVGEFHRDSDYAHGPGEINFWLPVTRAWATNTVWIESEEGAEDFEPHECEIGEVLIFDGVRLKHGNRVNATGKTRVSFDFRIVPRSRFRPSENVSINTNLKFDLGGYFDAL